MSDSTFLATQETSVDPRFLQPGPVPASRGQLVGAMFSSALSHNPGVGLYRYVRRELDDLRARGVDPATMEQGEPDDDAPALLSVEAANERFGIPGQLTFTAPIAETAAQEVSEIKRRDLLRADIVARSSGVGTMTLGYAAALMGSVIDPLNVASAFVPVVGPVRAGAWLAQAGSRLGRVGVAARIGAIEGAVGGAMLAPINAFVQRAENRDYDMASAVLDVAFGGFLGAGLHSGGRALVDALRGWHGPEMHDAITRAAVAQVAQGEPVNVEPFSRIALDARRAEIARLFGTQERAATGVEAAEQALAARVGRADTVASRIADLRAEAESLGREVEVARARAETMAADPATAERLSAVEAELGRTIPRKRRADLEREREMLLEGRDYERDALEGARAQAEALGLERAQARAGRRLAREEARFEAAEGKRGEADDLLRRQRLLLESRQNAVRDLVAKELRTAAREVGAKMDAREVADAAARIARASAEEADATITRELSTIAARGTREVEPLGQADMSRLIAEAGRGKPLDPQDAAGIEAARVAAAQTRAAVDAAPTGQSPAVQRTVEHRKDIERLDPIIRAQEDAGRLPADERAAIKAADDGIAIAEARATAWEAAAACMIANGA